MLTNEILTLLNSLVPAPATTFSLRFGKQNENVEGGRKPDYPWGEIFSLHIDTHDEFH